MEVLMTFTLLSFIFFAANCEDLVYNKPFLIKNGLYHEKVNNIYSFQKNNLFISHFNFNDITEIQNNLIKIYDITIPFCEIVTNNTCESKEILELKTLINNTTKEINKLLEKAETPSILNNEVITKIFSVFFKANLTQNQIFQDKDHCIYIFPNIMSEPLTEIMNYSNKAIEKLSWKVNEENLFEQNFTDNLIDLETNFVKYNNILQEILYYFQNDSISADVLKENFLNENLINLINSTNLADISSVISIKFLKLKNYILLIADMPLILSHAFTLYKVYPSPTYATLLTNFTITMYIQQKHNYIGLSSDNKTYFTGDENSLNKCYLTNSKSILCSHFPKIRDVILEPICEVSMLLNITNKQCNYFISVKEFPIWLSLENHVGWLYAIPTTIKISMLCPNNQKIETYIAGTGILQMNPKCQILNNTLPDLSYAIINKEIDTYISTPSFEPYVENLLYPLLTKIKNKTISWDLILETSNLDLNLSLHSFEDLLGDQPLYKESYNSNQKLLILTLSLISLAGLLMICVTYFMFFKAHGTYSILRDNAQYSVSYREFSIDPIESPRHYVSIRPNLPVILEEAI
ncbi:uncharacterized protein LOC127281911 [Leptopilina boulardi]|uniref:uncharacterized protein LOC127281911 n=1 Tax=Leptopilina boulardi TaxID=63433 RepID=UPI0021F5B8E8|nr:uncharacterized protein LOC127281911 [Leptopilina boulardi]